MRAKHCQEAGWFPTYTMCEDFALALELQSKKYKAAYVQEFMALGEVPVTVRGTFQQRSRSALFLSPLLNLALFCVCCSCCSRLPVVVAG